MAADDKTKFYDWNGHPVWWKGGDIWVTIAGGKKRRVTELVAFAHEATPVSRARYDELKKAATKAA
jgi:hypothetical protein